MILMTPIYPCEPTRPMTAWRLDKEIYATTWDSGLGAFKTGGRWNRPKRHVVYASLDPSTITLEVAVHTKVRMLDRVPHVVTAFEISDPGQIHIVRPQDIPNPRWLHVGETSKAMLDFGHDLLDQFPFVALPSAVTPNSWNLIFDPVSHHFKAGPTWRLVHQGRFGLDTRLTRP